MAVNVSKATGGEYFREDAPQNAVEAPTAPGRPSPDALPSSMRKLMLRGTSFTHVSPGAVFRGQGRLIVPVDRQPDAQLPQIPDKEKPLPISIS